MIKPIRTEPEYVAALDQVTLLMDAKLGTPEGDKLDALVTLIEAYEDRHHHIDKPNHKDTL